MDYVKTVKQVALTLFAMLCTCKVMDRSVSNSGDESGSAVASLDAPRIPFQPLAFLANGGAQRRAVFIWLGLCLLAIPSGMLTRVFEWSGMSIDMGGMRIHLTAYLPMLISVPLVLLYGFWWAAIPAYLSTFCVAMLGGMSVQWALLFSCANPIGLAVFVKLYGVTGIKTNMRSLMCVAGFVVISLLASLSGSIGAFIWVYTNDVGITSLYRIWQGWWLGGWLQNLLIVTPLMWLISPYFKRVLDPIKTARQDAKSLHNRALPSMIGVVSIVVAYVYAARYFALNQFQGVTESVTDPVLREQMLNTVDGLSYPLYIMILILATVSYFGYKALVFWSKRLHQLNDELEVRNKQLEELATIDALSGLLNRRKVLEIIEAEFVRAHRLGKSMCILMIDADHFKRINDDYGHLAGDDVISSLAQRLSDCLREYDVLGRYGGEEFIAMLPETTIALAHQVGERIRDAVQVTPLPTSAGDIPVTISIGLASMHRNDNHYTDIIERADRALYKAKDAGRNCVELDQTMVGGEPGLKAAEILRAVK